jgi:uncharacterized protein (TIGR02722 family)
MKTRIFNVFGTLLLAMFILSSCGPSRQVSRIGVGENVDLSGKWNDVDSRMVSKDLINQVLDARWLNKFKMANSNKLPVVIVGKVKNKTSEHIKTATFIKDLERELINSGEVEFVASKDERNDLREERMEQQGNASQETTKQMGNETGADFMLLGQINSITDAIDGQKIIYYQIDMELMNIETNKKVWAGFKKIKKYVGQDKYEM